MTDSQRTNFPAFTEHRVQRDRGSLYVRDFPGSGAAFVLLHGFPDNSHIYDDLIPHLTSVGRRTISIDFLGFGASDKPEGRTTALNNNFRIWKRSWRPCGSRRSSRSATMPVARPPSTSL